MTGPTRRGASDRNGFSAPDASAAVESFQHFVAIVRKRGPEPYWTPVAPIHRLFSFFLSYLYVVLRMTPLAVTLWGLLLALAGVAAIVAHAEGGAWFWVGVGLLNLGVIHDACDGEVARYRLHHGLQSTATYRVGMFADFWAFAIVVQALLPLTLGFVAWRRGATAGLAVGGLVACLLLLASYSAGYARRAYWPGGTSLVDESISFAAGGPAWLRFARRAYFYVFETAMFTTHATLVLIAWTLVGSRPAWAVAYVVAVVAALCVAFLVAIATTLRDFDREPS